MRAPPRAHVAGRALVRTLGRTEYEPTWRAMQAFTSARAPDTPDEIWLTEHHPVYTLGLAGRTEHLLRTSDIPVIKVDRGGQVTYHGPGQLVAYVLWDLRRTRQGVRATVRAIESAVVEWLDSLGISALRKAFGSGRLRAGLGGRGEDRRARAAGAQRLHLPWTRGKRRDGSLAFCGHRPVRLSGTRGDATRRSRRCPVGCRSRF